MARLTAAMDAAPPADAFPVAGCCAVLGDILLQAGRNEEALAAAERGLRVSPTLSLDLCLTKSEALRRLHRHDERVTALAEASRTLRSFVLRIAWLEALIDAGRGTEALPAVEKELADSRWRSSWLIRRARIRLQTGDTAAATADLQEARTEIESRLKPDNPDLSLVCDHGVTLALLGDRPAAAAALTRARTAGADGWMTRLLTDLAATPGPPPP